MADVQDDLEPFGNRPFHERYRLVRPLGRGGMAVVFEGQDTLLGRTVALKQSVEHESRFAREILLSARLEHPNIVTVHDAGLIDHRLTFVMPVVVGKTFRELFEARLADEPVYGRHVTLPRMIDALKVVCDAVGYAHERGVLHRDLKPSNLMLGPHGEVHVLDWGIAMVEDEPEVHGLTDIVRVQGQTDGLLGTPGYLAPENFEDGEYSPASDVFSLGVVLFQLLTGKEAFRGRSPFEQLMQLKHRRRRALRGRTRIPRGLAAICRKALAWEAEDRHPDGMALARALEGWLESSKQRDADWARADELVDQATTLLEQMQQARDRAQAIRDQCADLPLPPRTPLSEKEAVWRDLEQAEATELSGDLAEGHALDLLHTATATAPAHDRSRDLLCATVRDAHARAERRSDAREAARLGHTLRFYDERGAYTDYLDGLSTLEIATDPPASVRIRPIEADGRRLLPGRSIDLGQTPLSTGFPRGSYLLEVEAPSLPRILIPVWLDRQGRWPPKGDPPIALPDAIAADECFVAGGPFRSRSRGWAGVPALLVKRHPVTHAEWSEFVADGGPRPRFEGEPEWPVVGISAAEAVQFAAWTTRRTQQPWRLPTALEWEKCAGGVDGREFLWGDHADCSWGRFRDSVAVPGRIGVDQIRLDESIYGIRGMASHVSEWLKPSGAVDRARGASWNDGAERSAIAIGHGFERGSRLDTVGFRLVRTYR